MEVGIQTEIVHYKEVLTHTEILPLSHHKMKIHVERIVPPQDSHPEFFPLNKESTTPITS